MFDETKFPRGIRVRDKVSLFEGIVQGYRIIENGSFQISVQPQGTGERLPDAYYIDTFTLEIIDPIPLFHSPDADLPVCLNIGDKVEDTVTERTGTVVELLMCLNGCILACVQPLTKGGANDPTVFVKDHRILTRIKAAGGDARFANERELLVEKARTFVPRTTGASHGIATRY